MPETGPGPSDRRALAARLRAEVGHDRRANAVLMRHVFTQYADAAALVFMPFEDHVVLFSPRDDKIGMTLLAGRPWQRRFIDRAFSALETAGRLRRNGLYVDVGANIGTTTLYALRTGCVGHALAYEPEPHNAQIFARNMALNGLDDVVILETKALGAAPGRLTLSLDAKNLGAHSLDTTRVGEAAGHVDVVVVTLDQDLADRAMSATELALVKIDVEGYELEVLAGMGHVLSEGVPILIEAGHLRSDQARFGRLVRELGPAYRFVVDVDRDKAEPVVVREFVPSEEQHELLFF